MIGDLENESWNEFEWAQWGVRDQLTIISTDVSSVWIWNFINCLKFMTIVWNGIRINFNFEISYNLKMNMNEISKCDYWWFKMTIDD